MVDMLCEDGTGGRAVEEAAGKVSGLSSCGGPYGMWFPRGGVARRLG